MAKQKKNKNFKVNVNHNVVGVLNLLKDKKDLKIQFEHDEDMAAHEAQISVPTDPKDGKVIIKANTNLWDTAYGCIG